MDKFIFTFVQGRKYIGKSKVSLRFGRKKIYLVSCLKSELPESGSNVRPYFESNLGDVHVVSLDKVSFDYEKKAMEVEKAIIQINSPLVWSEDIEVLAFPFDMPKFEYENNKTK